MSRCLLNTDRVGALTTPLGVLWQGLTTFLVKKGFLIFSLNSPWCSFGTIPTCPVTRDISTSLFTSLSQEADRIKASGLNYLIYLPILTPLPWATFRPKQSPVMFTRHSQRPARPKQLQKRRKNTPEAWRWLKPAVCEFQHSRLKQLSGYTLTSCPAPSSLVMVHGPSSQPRAPEAPSWIFCRSVSPFPKPRLLQLEVRQEWPLFCLLNFQQRKPSLNLSMSVLRHLQYEWLHV